MTASSSAAFADAVRPSDPSSQPFAAVDGDPYTAWQSSSLTGPKGQWLEAELDTPRVVDDVTVRMVDDGRVGWPVTRVRITTDAGSVDHDVDAGSQPQTFSAVSGLTGSVRLTVLSVAADRTSGNVGIAELAVPGVTARRALRVPTDLPDGTRATFAFTRGTQPRYPCATEGDVTRCDSGLTRFGEEPEGIHRIFRNPAAGNYRVEGDVLPVLGGRQPVTVDGIEVTGSSQLAGDPAAGPLAAVDHDPNTTWIADLTDRSPTLKLHWPKVRQIDGLKLSTSDVSGAAMPSTVDIRTPFGRQTLPVASDGSVPLDTRTDQLQITVIDTRKVGKTADPPGIGEVEVLGAQEVFEGIRQDTPISVPCGAGPNLDIDGVDYPTTISGTLADVTRHRSLTLGTCRDLDEGVDLDAGEHELRTDRSPSFVVQNLRLVPSGTAANPPGHRDVTVQDWSATHRSVQVAAGADAVLTVPENANDGWVATVDGQPLPRTRVDGWQQAWRLPAGGPVTVRLDFVPDESYRTRLTIGAVAALLVLVLVVLPIRRRKTTGTEPAGRRWVPIALAALVAVLGGMPAVVLLIACLLARAMLPGRPVVPVLAFGGMAVATVAAIAGRLLGNGQSWAYGPVCQGAILLAIAAVVAGRIDWFDGARRPASGGGKYRRTG